MPILTKNQRVAFQSIQSFRARFRRSPSVRELQEEMAERGLRVQSTRSVAQYLDTLEEKGLIERSGENYGIEMGREALQNFVEIPIYGSASAGALTLVADENLEGFLQISKSLLLRYKNTFAVEVQGDSMNRAKVNGKIIEPGDYVLVDYRANYKNGDVVLAVIDGMATIKRIKVLKDKIGLFPESSNDKNRPIYLALEDDMVINGRVVDVLKT